MKLRILFTLFFAVLSFHVLAQESGGKPIGKALGIECAKHDYFYLFSLQDISYKTVKRFDSFAFHGNENDFDELYEKLMDGFENTPVSSVSVEHTREPTVYFVYTKSFGVKSVQFIFTKPSGHVVMSTYLRPNKLKKLFGKN